MSGDKSFAGIDDSTRFFELYVRLCAKRTLELARLLGGSYSPKGDIVAKLAND